MTEAHYSLIDSMTLRRALSSFSGATVRSIKRWSMLNQGRTDVYNPGLSPAFSATRRKRTDHAAGELCGIHVTESMIEVSGSPSYSAGFKHNVFGIRSALDAGIAHLNAASDAIGANVLGDSNDWSMSRIDVTANFDMGSPENARAALGALRLSNAPRRRQTSPTDEVLRWGNAQWLSGTAYIKGTDPVMKLGLKSGLLTPQFVAYANTLLRLELRIGRGFILRKEIKWDSTTEPEFGKFYDDYWNVLVGDAEVFDMSDIFPALTQVAPSEAQARAAFRTFLLIRQVGESVVRESMPGRTWRRHVSFLRSAGLSWTDITTGQITPLRRKAVVLGSPVTEYKQVA
ncbi:phage/plasmid replication protein [Acidithiobacillus thiooxidans]|uniref:phage/plasmid replication domain-containing protein n=1 Tax=Acidithiobacillus thiooxidans TaxID=930 RepID=UPI002430B775|nr:phage/plasmid replication protein [Acidithiobacillus thiooxidans]